MIMMEKCAVKLVDTVDDQQYTHYSIHEPTTHEHAGTMTIVLTALLKWFLSFSWSYEFPRSVLLSISNSDLGDEQQKTIG